MRAGYLDEFFRLICGVVEPQAELEGNDLVVSAVYYHDGQVHATDVIDSGVAESGGHANGHIGIKLFTDINIRGETAFDDKGPGLDLCGEVCSDASAERPAEEDYFLRRDVFLLCEPFVCGFDIVVCSGFRRFALAGAVAAVVKNEAVEAKLVQYVYGVESMCHVAAVAVAEKDREGCIFGWDEPCRQFQAVFRLEDDVFKVQVDVAGIVRDLADGAVQKRWLHKVQCQRKDGIGEKNNQYD